MKPIRKYPRTRHLVGSRLQAGDEDLEAVAMSELAGRHVVIEEKMDGANSGLSFDDTGRVWLQSRGHYLTGGPRERQFNLFKQWAAVRSEPLFERLGTRHIAYGEWLYAKHTVWYDALPHYWMEFDILDTETGEFLDTPRRAELLDGLAVVPVRVLYSGEFPGEEALIEMVAESAFRTAHARERLIEDVQAAGWDVETALRQTDPTDLMEGLYIKIEEDGIVRDRFKWVRRDFIQKLTEEGHWQDRPLIPNRLADDVDLFG
ncbi:RNA ligase family protein [Zavarzinella formosa]|uniref:RNA ligase family protein n=1 Tax=Zavarzinella formosa TaxID=360055 RepID=UPI000314F1EA|nr:RNA ligase family protein [Zavarzinella formosa]